VNFHQKEDFDVEFTVFLLRRADARRHLR